jgi:hypothetical protein
VRKAAELRVLDAKANRELARFSGAPPVRYPRREVLQLGGEAKAWKQWCEDRLRSVESVRYESRMLLEQQRSEVSMYTQAIRLCADINIAAAKLVDEDYEARLNARQGDKLLDALGRTAQVLQFTPDMRARLWDEFSRQVRAVDLVDDEGA